MEEYLVEEREYKGYKIKIYQDPDPESPREWDNLGQMTCFHKRYELGDKHEMSIEELKALVQRKDVISLPLYLIDHSGLAINTHGFRHCDPQGWDWGQLGYILVDLETIRKEYGKKRVSKTLREHVERVLHDEVETYDQFLRGEVYGYAVTRKKYYKECNVTSEETVDSVWGYYGDEGHKQLIEEAKAIIDLQ